MSVASVLLRVLLALSLVLNGIATAAASAHSPATTAGTAAPAPSAAPARMAMDDACHHGHGIGKATHAPRPTDPKPHDATHGRDCCKSGPCSCDCVHTAQLVVASAAFAAPPRVDNLPVRPMLPGHAAPALPHILRPPIG